MNRFNDIDENSLRIEISEVVDVGFQHKYVVHFRILTARWCSAALEMNEIG